MRFFIAQRVTGEDINKLRQECDKIKKALDISGHNCYCALDEGESFEFKSKKKR